MTFDNLGGNSSLGYVECFNATYFCRICQLTKTESTYTTRDDLKKHRTKIGYYEAMEIIEDSFKVDVRETMGYKEYCPLNDLRHFHILDNMTVDIMHDLCEGAIPFLLTNAFK